MSYEGFGSAAEWARGIQSPGVRSLRDVEAAIVHFRPESVVASGLRPPERVGIGAIGGWLGAALIISTVVASMVGPAMYFDGRSRSTRGGIVEYEFDADRASLLVPIAFGFLSLALVWSVLSWVRSGRPKSREAYFAVLIGGSALWALWSARDVGIDISFGENLESLCMWICAALALITCVIRLTCSRKSDLPAGKRAHQNVGFELRAERRELAMILTGRGLLNEPDLEAALAKPIGFHLREDGSAGE